MSRLVIVSWITNSLLASLGSVVLFLEIENQGCYKSLLNQD